MKPQQNTPAPGPRRPAAAETLTICLLLVASIAAIYGQTAGFDFVLYDDPDYVTDNPFVRAGLSVRGFVWALTTLHASNWHPLTWLSHMLDYQLFGPSPGGHHLSSVVLHALNTLLLFVLLRRLTAERGPSAFVAALFAVHPLHVESVVWVAERKDVLSTSFFLLATLAYVGFVRRGGLARFALVAVLFVLGLMSKPMVVSLPFVLLLLDYWPLRRERSWAYLVAEKTPLFVLSAASATVTMIAQRAGGSMEASDLVPFYLRVVNATVSYARYVGKILWPTELSVLYPHPNLAGGTPWAAWQLAAAGSLLVVITVLAVAASGRRRYLATGWGWFVITLLPVIGLVQVGQQAMADRYTYVPSIGLFVMVTWGVADWLRSPGGRPAALRAAVAVVACLVLFASAVASWNQVRHWRDSVTLFEWALTVSAPTPVVLSNLGVALAGRGRLQEAIECQRRALEISPAYGRAQNNLGIALQMTGRLEEAIRHYRRAIEIDPDSAGAHNNLCVALRAAGRPAEAVVQCRRSLAIDPHSARAHFNLANALRDLGRRSGALAHYRRALELDPGFDRARESRDALLVGGP